MKAATLDENEPIQPLQQPELEDYTDRTGNRTLLTLGLNSELTSQAMNFKCFWRLRSDRVERQRRNVEILKIRFREAALVMPVHFNTSTATGVAHEFTVFKPDKKLKWLPHLSTVQLEIQLEDRTLEMDGPIWVLEDLTEAVVPVDRSPSLKAMWVDHGVLTEDPEFKFNLLERADMGGFAAARKRDLSRLYAYLSSSVANCIGTVRSWFTSCDCNGQQQQAEQMRVYWKFIEGILTDIGALLLDIRTMVTFPSGYDRTIEQLGGFMEAARREGLVVVRNGIWRVNE
ncbi:hypothetical protein M413DRAFT_28224 [Hebeloma cylindrosporum]|uniref:Anaphase-promoting complex subunit 2 C-terminal domain-containing protein n=1 Tax=Hebeloma cylindrosporum TaxID=76867 RepID=A0A0C3CAC5_HEBCY|nr:hypothetical protein M413DRAFT_28224 [Hebeloma cylindrosporum h7]